MDTISVSLPAKLKKFAEQQVSDGNYTDISDYFRDILRKDQARIDAIAEIQAALNEGDASGFVSFDPDEFLQQLLTLEPRDAA